MLLTALAIVTPPAAEPLTLDQVRAHLRLDEDFDDALLGGYLTAARAWAEAYLGRALPPQTLQWTVQRRSDISPFRGLDAGSGWGTGGGWPAGPMWPLDTPPALELPRAPVGGIAGFLVLDRLGNVTASAPASAAQPSGNTLQFATAGCPAALGQFVQDLSSPAAVSPGATVSGLAAAGGTTTVGLSAPLAAPVGQGDNILFSTLQSQPVSSGAVASALQLTGNSLFVADLALEPARLRPDWAGAIGALGTVSGPAQHLQITFTAGYGAVPQPILQAILMLTAFFYERRGDDEGGMPLPVYWLLDPYRIRFF